MLEIYYTDLRCDCSKEQSQCLYSILPLERQERIRQLKKEEVRKKSILAGAFLQYVLSIHTGLLMNQITYEYGEHGKPRLSKAILAQVGNLEFNLSHSGNYAVLAISDEKVGIDIEHKRRNYQTVAKRCFCEEEYHEIMKQKSTLEQEECFLEYWTMKEAYIKHSGEGLRIPLDSFLIRRIEKNISCVEGEKTYFCTFSIDKNYKVSICSGNKKEIMKLKEKFIQEEQYNMKKIEIIGNITDREIENS